MGRRSVDLLVLKRQLLDVIDILNEDGITYHLEGGTLLGIVREGRLLPWDKDTDISIMEKDLNRFLSLVPRISKAGWRVSKRFYEEPRDFAEVGESRLFKIKDRQWYFFSGPTALDVFVKHPRDGYVYWQAAGNVMRVSDKFYSSYETVEWEGRELKVPMGYRDYLTEKYGDWSIPVKDWHCDNEKTVVLANPNRAETID